MLRNISSRLEKIFLKILFLLALVNCQVSSAQNTDSTATDSTLLKQIEQEMGNSNPPPPVQTRSGLSFNPDIGVIGDFRGAYISEGKKNIDAYLNETELSLQ